MSPGNLPRYGIRRPRARKRPTTRMKPPTMMSNRPMSGTRPSYRPRRTGNERPGSKSSEADPADRLLDLRLLNAGDCHAVDHGQGNVFYVDVERPQVAAVELPVRADVLLEGDAAVLEDLLDPAAALAVWPGIDNNFHVALASDVLPPSPRGDTYLDIAPVKRLYQGYQGTC